MRSVSMAGKMVSLVLRPRKRLNCATGWTIASAAQRLRSEPCRIHLIQLPPYCPHLNPIERLWAVMHQSVTHNRERRALNALDEIRGNR